MATKQKTIKGSRGEPSFETQSAYSRSLYGRRIQESVGSTLEQQHKRLSNTETPSLNG